MQERIMIPQTPSYERSGPRYIDGEFPIEYPERYRRFLRLACYKIAQNIQALYENRFNRVRICMSCYETHPNLTPNFKCKIEWHSIGGETEVRMECARCNTMLLRRRRAFECLRQDSIRLQINVKSCVLTIVKSTQTWSLYSHGLS